MSNWSIYTKKGQVINLDNVKYFYKHNASSGSRWNIQFSFINDSCIGFSFETEEERDKAFNELINQLGES
jgi:hypothetical protein